MLQRICVFLFIAFLSFPSFCFTTYVINVKQGSSSFIKLSEKSGVLCDAGKFQAAPHIIQYLKDRGIDTIKMAILSHPDFDHIGGFEKIIQSKKFVIRKIVKNRDKAPEKAYKKLIATIKNSKIPVLTLKRDTVIENIEIKNARAWGGDIDHRSLVVYYLDLGKSIAIMGDADSNAEKSLSSMKVDALVIGNHGGASATCKEFLDAVKPEMALISVGKNTPRQPAKAVLERLQNNGIIYYRTDKIGDIEVAVVDWVLIIKGSKSPH